MNADQQHAQLFAALGHHKRLLILKLLQSQNDTMSVDWLLNRLAASGVRMAQSNLSHHLKELCRVGLVDYTQHGLHHYYAICPGVGNEIAAIAMQYTRNEAEQNFQAWDAQDRLDRMIEP